MKSSSAKKVAKKAAKKAAKKSTINKLDKSSEAGKDEKHFDSGRKDNEPAIDLQAEGSSSPAKLNLKDYFATVKVVNLDKFPDRWTAFKNRAAKLGVTGFDRFSGVLGDAAWPPVWWRAGNGAWGCLMSHLHIVQRHLSDGNQGHLLLFEDDAVFGERFPERVKAIMEEVGDDWDMLYLGGQHLHMHRQKPKRHKGDIEVIRPYNINRTHGFAVNKRFAAKFQQHIIHAPDYIGYNWVAHIDHQLGVLHESGEHKILAAQPWVCGQAAGKSWTSGKLTKELWWNIKEGNIVSL